jgi:precorrin-4 methylase
VTELQSAICSGLLSAYENVAAIVRSLIAEGLPLNTPTHLLMEARLAEGESWGLRGTLNEITMRHAKDEHVQKGRAKFWTVVNST